MANRLFGALLDRQDEFATEEIMLGLSSEFYMQVEWQPGGWFEEGELILDPCFNEPTAPNGHGGQERRWDEKSRGFIFNFIRQYGDLEYVNVGRVIGSLCAREGARGRRDVYVAQIKPLGSDQEIVKILRMQKWGIRERPRRRKEPAPGDDRVGRLHRIRARSPTGMPSAWHEPHPAH